MSNGDLLRVNDGGTTDNTTINNGGNEEVFHRGLATRTTINDGGVEIVVGGKSVDTTINGGVENVISSAGGSPGVSERTTINSGGVEDIGSGKSYNTNITSGGVENVRLLGRAFDTMINSGGVENVIGGVTERTLINSDGILNDKGIANHTTINGGVENVSGNDYYTTIKSGGVENVNSSGEAFDTTIASGGVLNIKALGDVVSPTINSGGVLNVLAGGSASHVTFSGDGGTVRLANPADLKGSIIHWQIGDIVDLLNTKVTAVSENGSSLLVQGAGFRPVQYHLVDQQPDTRVAFQSDGHGGTDLILVPIVGVHDHLV